MTITRHQLRLYGCQTQPLSSYLKSIGLARLVHRQLDPTVRCWFDGGFVMDTARDANDLVDFLVDDYQPTPIVNPWNNGAGFGPGSEDSNSTAAQTVRNIESSTHPRLADYRATIAAARPVSQRNDWDDLSKEHKVMLLRNALPDAALDWLDSAVVFTSDSRTFPPLLGTGGNDGRLDFSSGFMQRVIELFGVADKSLPEDEVRALVHDALFGTNDGKLVKTSPGQFNPASAGGPRSAPAGSADAMVNPWDFVLNLEGAVAFASGVARRLGASASTSSVPFTVRATSAGFGTAADENSRGEFWAPVWSQPAAWPDISHLLREGRVEYRGRQARSGLEAAMALATLGVDRGIARFVRYSFVERNGLATFAVPLAEVEVRPNQTVSLLGEVHAWLERFRGDRVPASVQGLILEARNRVFALSRSGQHDSSAALFELLWTVHNLQLAALHSNAMREVVARPPTNLDAAYWLGVLDDKSAEFEVASCLASWRRPGERSGIIRAATMPTWDGRRAPVDGFGRRPLNEVLAEVIGWWATKADVEYLDVASAKNAWGGEVTANWCSPAAFTSLTVGRIDVERVETMLAGLMLLDWHRPGHRRQDAPDSDSVAPVSSKPETFLSQDEATGEDLDPKFETNGVEVTVQGTSTPRALWEVPAWMAAMKICFAHRPAGKNNANRPVVASVAAARSIGAGRLDEALERCLRTLRVGGLPPRFDHRDTRPTSDNPYALALLTPLSDRAIDRLVDRVTTFDRSRGRPPKNQNTSQGG